MSAYRLHSVVAVLIALLLVACSNKEATKPPAAESAKTQPSQPEPQPPATAAPTALDTPKTDFKAPPQSTPSREKSGPAGREAMPVPPAVPSPVVAPPSQPAERKQPPAVPEIQPAVPQNPAAPVPKVETKPVPADQQLKAAPDVIILKGSLGAVRFEHKLHRETRKIACETCHHASRPEKPATVAEQACSQCHTLAAAPPMKTKLQAAFHNPTATAGTCIDCHKIGNAKGQVAPVKCLDCHKKQNK